MAGGVTNRPHDNWWYDYDKYNLNKEQFTENVELQPAKDSYLTTVYHPQEYHTDDSIKTGKKNYVIFKELIKYEAGWFGFIHTTDGEKVPIFYTSEEEPVRSGSKTANGKAPEIRFYFDANEGIKTLHFIIVTKEDGTFDAVSFYRKDKTTEDYFYNDKDLASKMSDIRWWSPLIIPLHFIHISLVVTGLALKILSGYHVWGVKEGDRLKEFNHDGARILRSFSFLWEFAAIPFQAGSSNFSLETARARYGYCERFMYHQSFITACFVPNRATGYTRFQSGSFLGYKFYTILQTDNVSNLPNVPVSTKAAAPNLGKAKAITVAGVTLTSVLFDKKKREIKSPPENIDKVIQAITRKNLEGCRPNKDNYNNFYYWFRIENDENHILMVSVPAKESASLSIKYYNILSK